MFPIAGSTLPNDADEFARTLTDGLRTGGLTPKTVLAEGPWPELSRLAVDLTGAEATLATRLPAAHAQAGAGPKLGAFTMEAAPLRFEKIPVHLHVRLASAATEFARTDDGALALTLAGAADGEIDLHVFRADLEAGLNAIAVTLAKKQGAEVKSTRLEISAPTPRTLDLRIAVTAKVFIMTTTVNVRGRLELDDQLNMRCTGLAAEGEGIMAGLVESALRPRLAKLEGQSFALGGFVAAGLRMRDVAVCVDDALRLHAALAGA